MAIVQTYFEENLPKIESDLQSYINQSIPETQTDLRYMLRYHMGWEGADAGKIAQGKRIRPILAMLSAGNCGLTTQQILPFCTAIELLHNFSLIHDDIEDGDEKRRGRETLWKIWGVSQAINTGDLLFSMAAQSMSRAITLLPAERILAGIRAFHQTCNRLTIGQHLDMKFETIDTVEPDLYLEMIGGKTAALLGFCNAIGAILSGLTEEQIEDHWQFGQALGIAFQIQDDYLGIWGDIDKTGKASRSDISSRKKTFPILCGLAKKGAFFEMWNNMEEITSSKAEILAKSLAEEGIADLVVDEVERYTNTAMNLLKRITSIDNHHGLVLQELSLQLMNRNH